MMDEKKAKKCAKRIHILDMNTYEQNIFDTHEATSNVTLTFCSVMAQNRKLGTLTLIRHVFCRCMYHLMIPHRPMGDSSIPFLPSLDLHPTKYTNNVRMNSYPSMCRRS